ncbi:APC family permease [Aneurinibacillus thermoaerophilus]|uniref:APC family permease n=1 Tax=Aneurinibacillus thermoaerophilus TaxID=143495 RepID=A0A1G7ZJM1_ANETH|nr:APC family permease [Aneurinibacillus thermoaerophilus]MED0758809.1 APC family permease [Aneurinibacillus thermoaerophilus]MED0759415.1 APC family permease [Aneurinibacillus thermoaerophilus]QYY41833.1 APC family permease [Aneurinibacillus thermoaerophilus]SDH08913.1 Amino acid permease [Aneurinibacillus thermoaerophilus]
MSNKQAPHFRRTLTLFPLVILGLAYMAPMTVFSTYGVAAQTTHGMVPAAYIVALLAMLFTAYSYGKMVKAYPVAGSAYTYTQKTISPHLGFLVGWSVLMDYLFLPMINFLLSGIFLSAAFPSVPSWIWIILFIAMITGINILGIRMTAKVNGVLVLFQFLVTVIFVALAVKGITNGMGLGTLFSVLPFYNQDVSFSFVLAGASILCLSFLGFDAVTTLSEETIEPKKTVPRAIFLVTFIGGALFTFVSYITQVVYPDFTSFKVVDSAAFEIAQYIGGALFASLFLAGMITSTIASGMSSHASAARLLFAMGREGVLPEKLFGYVHPKYKTPSRNIFLISLFSLSALVVDLATAASFINFGALVAFTFVNLSVIFHYYIRNKQRGIKGAFLYVLLPLIGSGFTIWLWTNLDKHSIMLGSAWIIAGIVYLLYLTKFFTKKPPQLHFEEVESSVDSTEDQSIVS